MKQFQYNAKLKEHIEADHKKQKEETEDGKSTNKNFAHENEKEMRARMRGMRDGDIFIWTIVGSWGRGWVSGHHDRGGTQQFLLLRTIRPA